MKTRAVYDSLTGMLIYFVPTYETGNSCAKITPPRSHLWVLNSVHKKVCINCGMDVIVTSFYRLAMEEGLLNRSEIQRIRRRLEGGH